MRGRKRWAVVAVLAFAATALVVPAVVFADPDATATVRFGNPDAGTDFPPAEHDASFHAPDSIIPGSVAISTGGTVTFDVQGFHWPVIYEPGTKIGDVALPPFGPPLDPNFDNIFINDFGSRFVAAGPGPFAPWTSPPLTEPGKYLMLCNVTPHAAFAKMYGWIIVK